MDDVKYLMQDHFLKYASYVILDRAIPNVLDGLKPVQRRILYTLWMMHDGKLHKVANAAGQTMAYHPHGDGPIIDALVNMANKGYLLDMQGNFGNILTGDPAAAARYIETRLSPLAKETLFNPDITDMIPTYDSRHQEPVYLPAKIPLLLMHGAEGIAVGMATSIQPHNFQELLEAEIAILEGKEFTLLPDFPTGGIMDASAYDKGRGKVKLRAKVETRDPKTIVITEICYGTTTESLIRSIDEAAKRGKIKIDAINDYTSDRVEIEVKLPRGQYAQEMIDALYAYTECEVTVSSQVVSIKDNLPWEPNVHEILELHVEKLQGYLKKELELELASLLEKIFERSLEQIFIENRLYKKIETVAAYDQIHEVIERGLEPFHSQLSRLPLHNDREKLLNIPIRRISRFDIEKNQKDIAEIHTQIIRVEKDLKNIKKVTIQYLRQLLTKFGKDYPRKTEIQQIAQIDLRAIETRLVKVGFDPTTGFIGTKVTSDTTFECTNFDKLLLLFKDGSYSVMNIPEKQYVHHEEKKVAYAGAADKKTVINLVYKDPKTLLCYGKRFVISQFILDKSYRYVDEGMSIEFLSVAPHPTLELQLVPKVNQKVNKVQINFDDLLVKGVSAKGIKLSSKPVKKVKSKE
jgi:topoisomerase-4 subunit A